MGSSAENVTGFTDVPDHFNPIELLMMEGVSNQTYAITVLNRNIHHPHKFLIPFWNNAAVRVTVDGGTNRWLDYIRQLNLAKSEILPIDMVTGDFDSITDVTMNAIKEMKIKVVHTPDQDETDFTKALIELFKHCHKTRIKLDSVFVIYQSSGRIDHIMSNINTLFKCSKRDTPIFLISEDSISWLLHCGKTTIAVPESFKNSSTSWCSIVPFSEKCQSITTSGLKWNLRSSSMKFGELISTSNNFDGSDIVEIDTKTQLLWSMGLIPMFSKYFGTPNVES